MTSDPRIGTILQDRYRIIASIASGGMGVVYRGERLQLGRPVAIKFLHAWGAAHGQALKRFQIEARAMSRLSHPSCVSVIDFGVHEGAPYLVMDYVSGRTLRQVLDEGPLPVQRAILVCRHVLAGLAHAHGHGIIHRDIKPDNIVLTEDGGFGVQARILDFGMAKLRDVSTGLTVGLAVGTPSYMAPEQIVGNVDMRTDIYAAGVVLFEMLTGRKPFVSDETPKVLKMHLHERPPRLNSVARGSAFSSELEDVVDRALAKRPEDRFQSAEELVQTLDALLVANAGDPRVGVGPAASALEPTVLAMGSPAVSRPRRRRALGIAVAAVLVMTAVAAAALLLRPGDPGAEVVSSTTTEGSESGAGDERVPPGASAAELAANPAASPLEVVAARPPSGDLPELPAVLELIRSGRKAAAIDRLQDLQKRHRESAYVPYLLGTLLLDKMWGREGFDAYREALRRNPAYRSDPVVIRSAVALFESYNHGSRAVAFVCDEIGAAAIPYLEAAAKSRSTNISVRARQALSQLQR